jgi:hypothetical protein
MCHDRHARDPHRISDSQMPLRALPADHPLLLAEPTAHGSTTSHPPRTEGRD